MFDTAKKAWRVLTTRPASFSSYFGQYFRFARTRFFSFLTYTPTNGIHFDDNVRIQALSCLAAERPGANINVGADTIIYEHARIAAYGTGTITFGEGSIVGDVRIYARGSIKMGKRLMTSWNVFIQDFDPHPVDPKARALQVSHMTENFRPSYRPSRPLKKLDWQFPVAPITIGDDVWLGANCTILKGANIGNNCVVGTGSLVLAGTYPDGSILGGVPARVLSTVK